MCFPLCSAGNDVWLWGRSKESIRDVRQRRENRKYLPGTRLPDELKATSDPEEALTGAHVVIVAVPSHSVREVAREIANLVPHGAVLVSAAKGIEPATHLRMTQILAQEMPVHPSNLLSCLSGPNFAVEVARFEPTTTVVGVRDIQVGEFLQDVFMTSRLRVYTNPDVAGVEFGGALKNVMAIAVGIAEGMGLGYNARAGLITRGLTEMARFGQAMGCRSETFAGLSGMGDLVLTCTGVYSRNRQCGEAIGKGESLDEFLSRTRLTVEGIRTTQAVREISLAHNIEVPITEQVYQILFMGKSSREGVTALMMRGRKHEMEEVARYG
jgi:glycerol-3-phosphate dehydrogenase (NAD(P)+)